MAANRNVIPLISGSLLSCRFAVPAVLGTSPAPWATLGRRSPSPPFPRSTMTGGRRHSCPSQPSRPQCRPAASGGDASVQMLLSPFAVPSAPQPTLPPRVPRPDQGKRNKVRLPSDLTNFFFLGTRDSSLKSERMKMSAWRAYSPAAFEVLRRAVTVLMERHSREARRRSPRGAGHPGEGRVDANAVRLVRTRHGP